jgi:hypothetical protein
MTELEQVKHGILQELHILFVEFGYVVTGQFTVQILPDK